MSQAINQVIPEGYKKTGVGVIPEDWSAVQAKEVVEFFGGYGFSSRLASNSGTKWLKIANVGINEIKWDAISYLPEHLIQPFKDYSLKENDVVMALTRPLLGDRLKVAKLASNDLPALLNQRVAKLRPKNSNNLNFIYFSIQREDFIAAMNLSMAGTDPPNIGTNALGNIFIAIPKDDKEQTAIANALSDVDALLSELEKLIAKKQAIKTATMQQLLTGKTRLPQFAFYSDINSTEDAVEGKRNNTTTTIVNAGACDDSSLASQERRGIDSRRKGTKTSELGEIPEDWDAVPANKAVEFFGGYGFSSRLSSDSGVKWLKIANVGLNEVKWDADSYLPESIVSSFKSYSLKENDVVMALTRPLLGDKLKIARIASIDLPALLNQRVAKLITKGKNRLDYIFYVVQRAEFIAQMNLAMAGTDPSNIGTTALGRINILLPEPEEQTAIATILTDIDNEIQTLEQRLSKTRQIKQGMMQELLTGKTRLPFDKVTTSEVSV